MGMREEIDAALQAHAAWRTRFKDYLSGRTAFDTELAGVTDQCAFGRWLASEGYRLMPSEIHGQIQEVHAEFHRVAGEIVRKIKEKRFDEVRQDLSAEGPFNQTSARLSDLLHKASLREKGAAAVAAAAPPAEPAAQGQAESEGTPPPAAA
ncbi:MAG: CZB domain-containing protein [Rhodocyclales bacterium]|nr:CZB domain-containing protein [Rhodocyclales bacterium]